MMYAKGEGVSQDYKEAVKWFRMSAEQGHAAAQSNLGTMYGTGQEALKIIRRRSSGLECQPSRDMQVLSTTLV